MKIKFGETAHSYIPSLGGSNPDNAKPYVDFVKQIILDHKIDSVLDVGHGDWAMWRDYQFDGIQYTGVDVAAGISKSMTEKYGDKNKSFIQIDKETLLGDAELLICKDVMQHLSLTDIDSILLQTAKFPYLILCNAIYLKMPISHKIRYVVQFPTRIKVFLSRQSPFFPVVRRLNNCEIQTGGFRGLDLERSYFSDKFAELNLSENLITMGTVQLWKGSKSAFIFTREKRFSRKAEIVFTRASRRQSS